MHIIINGRKYNVSIEEASYDDLIALSGRKLGDIYTITYSKLRANGMLTRASSSIALEQDMEFSIKLRAVSCTHG